jgi:hypothetical protein
MDISSLLIYTCQSPTVAGVALDVIGRQLVRLIQNIYISDYSLAFGKRKVQQ